MTDQVSIGYLHPGQVDAHFHTSLLNMILHDKQHEKRLAAYLSEECGSGMVAWGRNKIVRVFLEHTDSEWLWFIDTDMGFAADAVDRLLESADQDERPIVGGLAFAQISVQNSRTELGDQRYRKIPTIFTLIPRDGDTPPRMSPLATYPRDAMVECDGTGAACLLIHRRVLEVMQEKFDGPEPWFANMTMEGRFFSEDLTFCLRAKACGFPIHVHTAVKTSHRKVHYLIEDPA